MKQKFYYSISNGGDGSASIKWMESAELADWHQDYGMGDEGWGENCSGSIELESDSPITLLREIQTKEKYLVEMIIDNLNEEFEDLCYHEDLVELLDLFNSPVTVSILPDKERHKDYDSYIVYVGEKSVYSFWKSKKEKTNCLQLENKINKILKELFDEYV